MGSSYKYLRGSDGTGNAVLAHITSPRSIASTVLIVDSLSKWSPYYIVTTGTLDVNGYMTPSSMTEMYAHTNAGQIIIDGFVPGYTDAGNTASQVAIIKPTNHFANSLVDQALVEHNDDGTHGNVTVTTVKQAGLDLSQQDLMRNAIINSSCLVAQRPTAPTLSTAYQFGQVDRFAAKGSGTAVSAGSVTQNTGTLLAGQNQAELQIANATITGTGIVYLRYRMEAKDAKWFKNLATSFSCRVYQNTGSAVNATVFINKPTVADTFGTTTAIANSGAVSIPTGTSTVLKFENINAGNIGDVSNGIEIEIQIACGAITTKTFAFADFVFNQGSKASTILRTKLFSQELADCQRYYLNRDSGNGSYAGLASAFVGAGQCIAFLATPVAMRATPAVTWNSLGVRFGGADYGVSSIAAVYASYSGVTLTLNTAGTGNGNTGTFWSSDGVLRFDAEL